jgi:hypothetical protein
VFYIRFFRNYERDREDYFAIGQAMTLLEAKAKRCLSGDLVVDTWGRLVRDPAWLWDRELADPRSLAHRLLRKENVCVTSP